MRKTRMIVLAGIVLASMAVPAAAQTLRGDFNMDGKVDISDATSAIACLLYDTMDAVAAIERDTIMVGEEPLVMVRVSAGTYTRRPGVVKVIPADYWIAQLEVSMEMWKTVMGVYPRTSSHYYQLDTDQAASPVSVEMCLAFIDSLNRMTGREFRLPTMDEWEFAAYGGKRTHGYTYAGSNNLDEVAWYRGNFTELEGYNEEMGLNSLVTVRQGTKAPNELGLYDMCGGVGEPCCDVRAGEPWYSYKGGYYLSEEQNCDPYISDHWIYISQASQGMGLRLVMSATE